MPTTRSATNNKPNAEHLPDSTRRAKDSTLPHGSKPNKRKRPPNQDQTSKKQKKRQQHLSSDNIEQLEKPIVINRAPVLQLWGAVVANFLHPDLPWPACLSVGNAISALCAVSKGRAIGMIKPKDKHESDEKQKQNSRDRQRDSREVSVMGFNLPLEDDAVLLSGKPKPLNESTLKAKFGDEAYEAAKKAMSDSLDTWADEKDELDRKAFHMYEKFRPNVATGQQGWGRKGELDLHEIARVIRRRDD